MNKIGFSHSNSTEELIKDLKKDMGVPEEDIVIVVHVKRADIERVCASLDLAGVIKQVGCIRPVDNRSL